MAELITKQSALDAIDKESEFIEREINDATKHPDEYTDNFISFSRERQCGLADAYIAVDELSPVETITDDDLVSRQAAIDEALTFFIEYLGGAFDEDSQMLLAQRMSSLPSAEPKGTWKRKGAYGESDMRDAYVMGLRDAKTETTPSAEPVHGEWVVEERDSIYGKKIRLTCSECGDVFDVTESAYPYERYCRYCGAKMDGGVSDGDTD